MDSNELSLNDLRRAYYGAEAGESVDDAERAFLAAAYESGLTAATMAAALIVVEAGDDPDTERPAGALLVYWISDEEPTNGQPDDLWWNGDALTAIS
jgi:hypothetical protein